MLKKQKDKFWKIDATITDNNNNTNHNNNNNQNNNNYVNNMNNMNNMNNIPPPPSQRQHQQHQKPQQQMQYKIKPKRIQTSSRQNSSNNIAFSTNAADFDLSKINKQQPTYQQNNNNNNNRFRSAFQRQQQQHQQPLDENVETNSDPGGYDGYQNGLTVQSNPSTPNNGNNNPTNFNQKPLTPSSTKKLKFHKKHRKQKKPPAKHKRGAQSNKFFNRDSKYLKNRNKKSKLKNRNGNQIGDTTINNSANQSQQIQHSYSLMADNYATNNNNNNNNKKSNKHGMQRSASANELPSPFNNNNDNHHHRRLSIMDTVLPTDINDYKVEEEFYSNIEEGDNEFIPAFGKVGIVSINDNNNNNNNQKNNENAPYLLQVINKSDNNHSIGLDVMDRMGNLINPYIITQLQRGSSSVASWSAYNCPSNGCLTNCLHLFRNVSVTSVRILIAEILCGLEYLHLNNFNFPNLSPETIYISHKSHIILTDFGFALPNNKDNIYRSGPLCYAPPEFLLNGVDDLKSDWWRLGVLIYHLIVGKPPFMGNREQVCQQICQSIITKDTLFKNITANNDIDIDEDTKDIIYKLLKRDRKERLGCNSKPKQIKKSLKRSNNDKRYGINAIMNHLFFECIWNKKNKDYQYTWNNIRKREHKPAPILRHLATRATDSPRERLDNEPMNHSFNDWKDEYDGNYNNNNNNYNKYKNDDDDKGSIVDTTDDEEFQTDEEDEKSAKENSRNHSALSRSGGGNAPILPPINDEITSTSMPNQGISPLNSNPYGLSQSGSMPNNGPFNFSNNSNTNNMNMNNNGNLSPLPQSPATRMSHVHHKASIGSTAAPPTQHMDYPPPPQQTPQFMGQPLSHNSMNNNQQPPSPISMNNSNNNGGNNSNSNSKSGSRPITPISTQFNIRPKGARHRKQLSSKIDFVPSRALPPAPPNKQLPSPPKSKPPQLAQSQPQEYGSNGMYIYYLFCN